MSERDILNPKRGYDPDLGDSMNPNQGWQRTRTSTLAIAKPAGGRPIGRETGNAGHTYQMSFTRRNLAVTERLKRFFEQFENGFFTFIDWDSGRQYVGRFVGEMPQSFPVNGRFTSQGWTFEEVPGVPMLEYPQDFSRWGISQRPVDDFGDLQTACTAAAPNSWAQPAAVADPETGVMVQPRQLVLAASTAGDSITHEYRGYGFRLSCGLGPQYGTAQLIVDGQNVQVIDFYAAEDMGVQVVYTSTQMSLDLHRVQLVAVGKNAAATGNGLLWDQIEVIR